MDAESNPNHIVTIDSHFVNRLPLIDPFSQPGTFVENIANAVLATAFFRCLHLILFFSAWAAMVVLISEHVHDLAIQSTLLTVFGTVLGFVISYRTSSSFERYNEGRRYWSAIIQGSRTLARTIWLHVPDTPTELPEEKRAEGRLRTIIEKKTTINLIQAFSVALKHYLRGEEDVYYEDLYHLVKFLPPYFLPAGRPSFSILDQEGVIRPPPSSPPQTPIRPTGGPGHRRTYSKASQSSIPISNITPTRPQRTGTTPSISLPPLTTPTLNTIAASPPSSFSRSTGQMFIDTVKAEQFAGENAQPSKQNGGKMLSPPLKSETSRRFPNGSIYPGAEPPPLLPARSPPKWSVFDLFPLSLFVPMMAHKGREVQGKAGAKLKARRGIVSQNIPLEISIYLSSYISALQQRKAIDVPTINTLLLGLNQLVDSLTGLERILTTPIPFSYSIHLWTVSWVYCALLPFQLVNGFRFLTIPATAIAAFIFFGFLVAGEEIENPFGYDKNDLNLDYFTRNIIGVELNALTARAPPNPSEWAFHNDNVDIFALNGSGEGSVSPKEWIQRGEQSMRDVLSRADK